MPSAAGLEGVHADLDSLRARLEAMVTATGGTRPVVPAPRTPGTTAGEPLPEVGDEGKPAGLEASEDGTRPMPGTVKTIAQGLELPALARRRFRAGSGCVLADADRKSQADDGLAARHPAAKVSALWRADLADGRACRYEYESRAWGYAALRWLLVDPGDAVGVQGRLPVSAADVAMGDVARLRSVTGRAAEAAGRSETGQARQALVRRLSTDAARLLRGRCSAQVNRELLAVTAEATLLTGCLTYACRPSAALAQAYSVQALALAQACGDRQLGAAVLCAMSEQAFFNGHLEEARNLVNAALSGTGDIAAPELAAHLRLLTARDHVLRNELALCARALKDAVTRFDGTQFGMTQPAVTQSDGAVPGRRHGWTRWFTEADPLLFALVLAAAYVAAGLPGPARDIRLTAQQLANRVRSPYYASYVSGLERRIPGRDLGARRRPAHAGLAVSLSAT
jgi:hypothetical protein